ncbi:sodium:proton antiporter [Pseudomonas aeruginosa]|uniref:sodium:proton antiporter n=1 Tax=Pseudomonas aeruginosa TaxID=287 RepID=UPI00104C1C6F|nr:sodium:proton antiporter [Pseudomonas aeruginosa]
MDQNAILLALGGIGAAALLSQWLAWRLRLPAILFLLLSGIVAGPLLGWLDPDEMFGPLLFPLVSLAVALILFEGSLTLHFSEWKEIGTVVHRMVTIGALSTWGVIALAAHYLLDFSWEMALLFGTLTLVTGPTVIVPMLRVVRPKAAVANILRWEGIVIDPIGALLAVVVYSFIISSGEGDGWLHSLQTFGGVILCGSLFGILGGWALGIVLRRHWLPDYLHNLATLAAVLGVFIASNRVMHESGLLAVTLMGMGLANMKGVDVRQIRRLSMRAARMFSQLESVSSTRLPRLFRALPMARLLKVAEPSPSGYLIVGANPVGRAIGKALKSLGSRVLLTDSSWENIRAARMDNLPTYFGNPTSQHAEAHLDLVGIGHLLGVSPAGELNTLAAMRFRHEFGHRQLFGLPTSQEAKRTDKHRSSDEHRGRPLGQRPLTYAQFASLLSRGAEIRTTLLTDTFGWNDYQALHGESAILLFARDPNGRMHVATPQSTLAPGTGWTLLSLIDAEPSVSKSQATEIAD